MRVKFPALCDAKAQARPKLRSILTPLLSMNNLFPVLAEWLAPLAVLFLVLRLMMGPAFFSSQRYFGVPGDSQQYMWFIGWVWHAIELGQSPFVSHAFNYPHPITIMDYTSVPSLGLLFGWLYAFTSVVWVYNLIIIVNYILIFIFGKLTLDALGIGPLFSSIGGFLFCLLPYLTAQAPSHLHMAVIFPLFMFSYCVAKLTRSTRPPGWSLGVLTGSTLTLAFYTSLETLTTLVLCVILLSVFALIACVKPTYHFTVRLLNPRFLVGMGVPLLLIIPGVLNYVQGEGPLALGLVSGSAVFSNDLLSFVVPSQLYLIHTAATAALASRFSGNASEWNGYLSVPFIMLFVVYAAHGWKKPMTRILTYTAASIAVFSLGPYLHIAGVGFKHFYLPWAVMLHLPFISDALPARLGLYTSSLALILVIQGADESVRQVPSPSPRLPSKLNMRLVANLSTLALVGLFWLPLLPSYSSPMPAATSILRSDRVVTRYIGRKPTLVLYDQDFGFSVVMGMLATSNDYRLVTSNIYGSSPILLASTSYRLNGTFMADKNGKDTDGALARDIPRLGVSRVMFVSTDNVPISSQHLAEISKLLGAPLFNSNGLVVVWAVPPNIG
jgi:hypothetical protein